MFNGVTFASQWSVHVLRPWLWARDWQGRKLIN